MEKYREKNSWKLPDLGKKGEGEDVFNRLKRTDESSVPEDIPLDIPTPEELLADTEKRVFIMKLIDSLGPREARIVRLYYGFGSEEFGVPYDEPKNYAQIGRIIPNDRAGKIRRDNTPVFPEEPTSGAEVKKFFSRQSPDYKDLLGKNI